ncbi:MAG: hypothetical protein RR150_13060 [Clostridia bacterium]
MNGMRMEAPLFANFAEMTLEQFGVLLMGRVYQEVSACASVDDAGRVVAFKLFDTENASEVLTAFAKPAQGACAAILPLSPERPAPLDASGGEGKIIPFVQHEQIVPMAGGVALFSNHPTGNMAPTGRDLQNLRLVPGATLYIVCERDCVKAEGTEAGREP